MEVDNSLKEIEKHGTDDFPIACYNDNCVVFKSIYTHWHKEMEIIYITDGRGQIRLDKDLINIKKGDIIFIGKEVIHHIISDIKDSLFFKSIVFDIGLLKGSPGDICQCEIVDPLLKNEIEMTKVISKGDEGYEGFLNIFLKIIEYYDKKPIYFYVKIKSLFFELFYEMLTGKILKPASASEGKVRSSIKTVLDYIDAHYQEDIAVSDLTKLVHYSEFYFMKIFKQYTGKTLVSYINELRLEKSKQLLIKTDLSVTDIGAEVGFCSSSYYIRKFQMQNKITPHKFRKEHK